MHPTFFTTALILGLIAGVTATGFAAEEKSSDREQKSVSKQEKSGAEYVPKTVGKEISGEVTGISKDFIAVMYREEVATGVEYEMGLNIEGVPQLERVTDISQIEVGAMVTVQYEEITERDDQDKEVTKRFARKIILTKTAPPPPPPEPEQAE